jgi:DNA-binding beta-propeller fold protein YncE
MNKTSDDWTLVCHLEYDTSGEVAIVKHENGKTSVSTLERAAAKGADFNRRSVFLGANARGEALMLDPESRTTERSDCIESDARYYYAYRDPNSLRFWFTNDGDKDGNDTLNCGNNGATVTVVAKTNSDAEVLETLLVGRGHHVSAFSRPGPGHAHIPDRAFVSNLLDGTIAVVGNDPNDAVSFLKIITTINLYDPRFEKEGAQDIPNNAFPHGMEFSPVTGKVYNLNNGYGTVAIIDPLTHKIETTIPMKVSSNLLLSRCGKFLIGKGADRKSDPDHVIGRLQVLDLNKKEVVNSFDIQDFYPSVYRFNPTGDQLYVTAAATGKDTQADNLRTDIVQVYDSSKLPELTLIKEIKLEPCKAGRRPIAFLKQEDAAPLIFVPNPTQGSLAVIDGENDEVLETVTVGKGDIKEFSISFWSNLPIYGG